DAWNRLVEVKTSSTVVQQCEYDGQNRRIVKLAYSGGSFLRDNRLRPNRSPAFLGGARSQQQRRARDSPRRFCETPEKQSLFRVRRYTTTG
ncbi:MAG TPA: hypothetical protein PJ982_17615, partial [Lacipirellulaceae bacterium]|nr:hypothetical protein [Lacipirellulaceae bacterium]